jgi:hypothetical protein
MDLCLPSVVATGSGQTGDSLRRHWPSLSGYLRYLSSAVLRCTDLLCFPTPTIIRRLYVCTPASCSQDTVQ